MNYLKSIVLLLGAFFCQTSGQVIKSEWISTTRQAQWIIEKQPVIHKSEDDADVEIITDQPLQVIEGFGACFNELGWISLNTLRLNDREAVLKELFKPDLGACFTICRMPVGANDFSLDWYSYNETEGDFRMKCFSIDNDLQTLVPFIINAKKYNPGIKIWASPWSPPSWMKYNKHYACAVSPGNLDEKYQNGLEPDEQGKEGTNMFIQQNKYFKAYSRYFSKFIEEYRQKGIQISIVMPQNEFNSCQIFPSCTWTASGLAYFIGRYLGPEMKKQHVNIMFGTMERPAEALVDSILMDPLAGKYIHGVGFQWAGKNSIAGIHRRYPDLMLYQSEQECGDGKNDWEYCRYAWSLMKHYISNGANAYMYWNISLFKGGYSRWGWQQNSLVTVDTTNKSYHYNYEYYLMKHLSHFVLPGARLLSTTGSFGNLMAFMNPDSSIAIIMQNEKNTNESVCIEIGDKQFTPVLKPDSFNTILVILN
jgi:glucosylceramidase